jgi:muramoyltetrapeptide carboxypeptidase
MSLQWHPLKSGDTVRIIAPGSKLDTAWEDLQKGCDFLRSLKLNPVYSKKIFAETKEPIRSYSNFANTDEKRYEDFVDAIHSDAQAVWCFRGGYGSDRVCQQALNNNLQPKGAPKLFVGFSDITNLHSFINTHWHWCTLHAASMNQLGGNKIDPEDVEFTKDIIFGNILEVNLTLTPLNEAARESKTLHGEVAGGNLTMVQSAIATGWQMPTAGKIVLFEDWGEAPYRIARTLQQFLNSKQLDTARAVILADFFSGKNENIGGVTPEMDEVLQDFAARCPVPVLRYSGVGHSNRNFPIPFGSEARLNLGTLPIVTVATGAALKSD